MKFTVKRSQWLHGEGGITSRLLRPFDKKMCCLGFLAKACGYTDEEIVDKGEPSKLDNLDKLPINLFMDAETLEVCLLSEIITINDYHEDPIEAEQLLIAKFAKLDIQLSFED